MPKKQNNKSSSFVVQAGILAAAGLISRIIGMLYRSPLKAIIHTEGQGYYSTAYGVYLIILLLSSYNIPMGVSKLISEQYALGKYKNAKRIFNCSLIYVVIIGGIASILTFVFAPYLVYDNPNAAEALRVLSLTIFFSGILGALRGYSQAKGQMVQTSISQIVEQVMNAVISIAAALALTEGLSGTQLAIKGAAGGAMGTLAGVLIGLIYMTIVFVYIQKGQKAEFEADKSKPEPYGKIFKLIFAIVTPIIFTAFITNITSTLNMLTFYRLMAVKGYTSDYYNSLYSVFGGEFVVLINVPIAIASSVGNTLVPSVSASYAKKNIDAVKAKISESVTLAMLIGIPAAVGLAVLSYPLVGALFFDRETIDLSASFLLYGSIIAVFNSFSTVIISALQAMGKVNITVRNSIFTLIIDIVVLVSLIWLTPLNIYSLLITMIVQSFSLCFINFLSLQKAVGYKQEIKKSFILPLISSLVMGIFAYGAYKLTYMFITQSFFISLIVGGIVGILAYFVAILLSGAVSEEELEALPKGDFIVKVAKKVKLIR